MTYRYRALRRLPGFDIRKLDVLARVGIKGVGFSDDTGSYKVKISWASPEAAAAKLNAHPGIPPESPIALTADDMRPTG